MLDSKRMWWLMHQAAETTTGVWELSAYPTEDEALKAMTRCLQRGAKIRALRYGDDVVLDAKAIAERFAPAHTQTLSAMDGRA